MVARKALSQLLAEKASQTSSASPHSAQDPHLAVVLDFTASLVADLTYAKRFADKSVWHRCVGVYISPWLPKQGSDGAAFAESVCKHFYAIEKVHLPLVVSLLFIINLTGQTRSCSRWRLGRGCASLQYCLLPRIRCPSPPVAHNLEAIPWTSLWYTWRERVREDNSYAPIV